MTNPSDKDDVRTMLLSAVVGDQEISETRDPWEMVIYHVGGDGGYGPVERVIRHFGNDCLLVIFDIRTDTDDLEPEAAESKSNVRKLFINVGVAGHTGRSPFHINTAPLSSSIFPPANNAMDDHVLYLEHVPPHGQITTWRENTQLASKIDVPVTTIDDVVDAGIAPSPDIISADAQGAEFAILQGAARAISETVLCTVTEVEFFEIYAGQGMFSDQLSFLNEKGFRLAEIYSLQYWSPSAATGPGMLTVGEAAFFRLLETEFPAAQTEDEIFPKLAKLARIAFAFDRRSFANKVLAFIETKYPASFRQFREREGCREMFEQYDWVQQHKDDYEKDHAYFVRIENRASQPSRVNELLRALFHLLPIGLRYRLRHPRGSGPAIFSPILAVDPRRQQPYVSYRNPGQR